MNRPANTHPLVWQEYERIVLWLRDDCDDCWELDERMARAAYELGVGVETRRLSPKQTERQRDAIANPRPAYVPLRARADERADVSSQAAELLCRLRGEGGRP